MTVSFRLRAATPWADAGHEVAWLQHQISTAEQSILAHRTREPSDVKLVFAGTKLKVTGDNFTFSFDRTRGCLTSWTAGALPLLIPDPATGAAIAPSFWRPPTDNDNPSSFPYWQRFGVDAMTSQVRSTDVNQDDDSNVRITFTTFLTPPVLAWGFLATTAYTICPRGTLSVAVHLKPTGSAPKHVPRAGLNLRLPGRLDKVDWLGFGPGESYPDKQTAQRVGVWGVDSVAELHTPYEVPQEGGNRMGTRWVSIREPGSYGGGVRVIAAGDGEWSGNCERKFSFKAGRFSDEVVQAAKHPCDLVEEEDGATLLRLDGRVAGVGTGACGPAVREDLMVSVEEMKFGFVLEGLGS